MILAGDIGGTKTLLALFEADGDALREVARQRYPSGDYAEFGDILDRFLTDARPTGLEAATIGVAGPVIDGQCRTTNLPWTLDTTTLRHRLGIERVFLLNDLQATAYGMLYLDDSDFAVLNAGNAASGNAAVLAAGTGLGEAILFRDDNARWHPIATEGGHCDFAPLDEQQDRLLAWLRQRYPDHVSIERIVSGPGLVDLHAFVRSERGEQATAITAEAITRGALAENDPCCLETLRLFARLYGAEAGNLALKSLARGGVYLGGGIAPKILPVLREGGFVAAFTAKGRFAPLLEQMPIKVSLNESTALLGAAWFARDHG